MKQTNDRYGRAIIRNLHELLRCLSYRNAYNSFWTVVDASDWSFFAYASLALYDGMFAHAIKVLDKHKDAASFFYLYNCKPKEIQSEFTKAGLALTDVESLASKLDNVRDKTLFHIDKGAVFTPNKPWEDANITGNFFNHVMDKLWTVLNSIHTSYFQRPFGQPIYGGEDVSLIIEAVKSKGIAI